jgi:hypothetical protein
MNLFNIHGAIAISAHTLGYKNAPLHFTIATKYSEFPVEVTVFLDDDEMVKRVIDAVNGATAAQVQEAAE